MRQALLLSLLFPAMLLAQIDNSNLTLKSVYDFGQEINDVWGYVDEQGNEYALVGLREGFSIVDVTDANVPDEVFHVAGFGSTWRDIKTHGDYAYITCEAPTKFLIVDMSGLPESTSLPYTYWQAEDTLRFSTAHNIYIDAGVAYIFGADYERGGAVMLDLTNDPMDPEPLGLYDHDYLHDGVVRGDTLWGSAVYDGEVQVVDVSDKDNPELISTWKTPSTFTHNAWFSDDNNYLFTTDEVRNGSIGAYDVSNILNPVFIDEWMPNDTGIVPHNTHFINDYLVTSYYTIGLSILDVSRPGNMIEVGRFDTSPDFHYEGFHGCWGAYPWLPSGIILATDIEEGLFVLEPNYTRACYLEGNVTHERTGAPIFFPTIEIIEADIEVEGDIIGGYETGLAEEGFYTVRFSKDGFYPKTVNNVFLRNGKLTTLDIELSDWPTSVSDPEAVLDQVVVAPNPANEFLSISGIEDFEHVALHDLRGNVVMERTLVGEPQLSLDLLEVPAGTYLLQMEGPTSYKKLIVRQ